MDPPHDCGWIHFYAALLHHLRQIAIGDPILAVLAKTNQNDLVRKTLALELMQQCPFTRWTRRGAVMPGMALHRYDV